MAASLLNTFQCGAYPSTCDTQSGTLHMRNSHCSISPTPSSVTLLPRGNQVGFIKSRVPKTKTMVVRASLSDKEPNENDNEDGDQSAADGKYNDAKDDKFRKDLERIVGKDDSAFSGIELATLIRNKYGRSYDVTLIKREFMGRNLLAMNVMWKYREQTSKTVSLARGLIISRSSIGTPQLHPSSEFPNLSMEALCRDGHVKDEWQALNCWRSFPLTEEEYLLRLDDVANNLKCWGAVSHVRNSLAKVKERPRIGKAVSIFIDLDESGGRANEWIYR